MSPVVYLGMPNYDKRAHILASQAFYHPTRGGLRVITQPTSGSLLPHNCNSLWADAFNKRREFQIEFFAMMHSDVVPEILYWLDTFHKIMVEHPDCDILSGVVPIANDRGLTSTGLYLPSESWGPRRLTLKEIFERPPTFTDPDLVVNTGLMLCRFDRIWCKSVDENGMLQVFFEQKDAVRVNKDGLCEPLTFSEDWGFSRKAKAAGAKIYATREVPVYHKEEKYTSSKVWGTWKTDKYVPIDGAAIGI